MMMDLWEPLKKRWEVEQERKFSLKETRNPSRRNAVNFYTFLGMRMTATVAEMRILKMPRKSRL
jgi:hypothetical protein